MKRPLAYLTAAWSGQPEIDMELAVATPPVMTCGGFSPSVRRSTFRCF